MTTMNILYCENDFKWHKRKLDSGGRYEHKHSGEPTSYPCKVNSAFWDNPNGPYEYFHEFKYLTKTKCEHCGHETDMWGEEWE